MSHPGPIFINTPSPRHPGDRPPSIRSLYSVSELIAAIIEGQKVARAQKILYVLERGIRLFKQFLQHRTSHMEEEFIPDFASTSSESGSTPDTPSSENESS